MVIRMYDTHCHPQFPHYDGDRESVIRRTLDSGVGMICVGTNLESSRKAIELADTYEGLYASVGWHPTEDLSEAENLETFISMIRAGNIVAIGEVGLDYYRVSDTRLRAVQKERFIQFEHLAEDKALPLIVHCRDAYEDMLAMIKPGMKCVIHSFNGKYDIAKKFLDYGCHIGLNAIVTFSTQYHEMVKSIPIDRILLETDSPYLAPAPYRGRRCEPLYVSIVGDQIARIRNMPVDEFIRRTTENARQLFGLQ